MQTYSSAIEEAVNHAPIIDMRRTSVAVQPPTGTAEFPFVSDNDLFRINPEGVIAPHVVPLRSPDDYSSIDTLCAAKFGLRARSNKQIEADIAHEEAHEEVALLLGAQATAHTISLWRLLYPGDVTRVSYSFGVAVYNLTTTRLGYAAIRVRPRDPSHGDLQDFVDLGYRDLVTFGAKAKAAGLPPPLALSSRRLRKRAENILQPLTKTA